MYASRYPGTALPLTKHAETLGILPSISDWRTPVMMSTSVVFMMLMTSTESTYVSSPTAEEQGSKSPGPPLVLLHRSLATPEIDQTT
jgi:hypothetical protein